jgi:hypothetical protein
VFAGGGGTAVLAERLAGLVTDPGNRRLPLHSIADVLPARMLLIGYEDADDLDRLCTDPSFKVACGRLPDVGRDLCLQSTMLRWENAPKPVLSHPPGLRDSRHLSRQLRASPRRGDAGHRRHIRCRAWATEHAKEGSANVAVKCALRWVLFLPIHVCDTAAA